ncbi:hypothetical protein E2562_039142 [Oryza meyeriana var. granulata]|uniref:RING-type domain-containing protein n=1 Tax=Oryza meyeriana var. granulata TaxID=110450 RepID=A0A6G1DVY6_9ORYZ|nr:hypothetical protein E2562_039142 [Oryza meyeriana var. granulata]
MEVEQALLANTGAGAEKAHISSEMAAATLHQPKVGETRERDCAVCLQDFVKGNELRMMPCSHSFHEQCIFRWLCVSLDCPICRFVMPSEEQEQRVIDE